MPAEAEVHPAYHLANQNTQSALHPCRRGAKAPRETKDKKTPGDLPQINRAQEEVEFAELDDGSLVELIEDPQDPTGTLLAVFEDGRVQYTDSLEHRGRTLVPMKRSTVGLADVRLPRGVRPNESVEELKFHVLDLMRRCVDIPDECRAVLGSFILYTWVADRLPVAVYLSVTGLPATGKTTLLELLSLLCRRALLVSDITTAATYKSYSRFSPTLLIDDNDWCAGRGDRIRRHQLRAGTTRNLLAKTMQWTSQCFGPKVLSSLEPPDDAALNSRCIQIPMTETTRTDLVKPTDLRLSKYVQEFQQRLLQFRFDCYKQVQPAKIPGAEQLRPRARDLLSSLAAPFVDDEVWCQLLLAFFLEIHQPAAQEPLPPAQSAVLAALFLLIHPCSDSDKDWITVGSFGKFVNDFLARSGERLFLQPRKIGSVLTSLGFCTRDRTNRGWRIWLDSSSRQRIHNLGRTYGLDYLNGWGIEKLMATCNLCKQRKPKSENSPRK